MEIKLFNFSNEIYNVKASYFSKSKTEQNVLLLPGAGYSCMGPVFYYIRNLCLDKKFNVINIEYDFRFYPLKEDSKEANKDFIDFIVNKLDLEGFKQFDLIIAKSVGTKLLALSKLSAKKYIWLTPSLKDIYVRNTIEKQNSKSLIAIDDKDPLFEESMVNSFLHVHIIKDAGHSLDTEGMPLKSIDALKDIIKKIDAFIS